MLLVTGAGRSGTSSMAGTLDRLGLLVPEPVVGANKHNPRGHYEPQWVVDLHKKYLKRARVSTLDGDPAAVDLVDKVFATDEVRGQIRSWLRDLPTDGSDVVVKDPRTFWGAKTWTEVARSAGYDVRFLTMLRHPAEVVGSRSAHYSRATNELEHRREEIANLAGWLNVNLINEATTRGASRAFVLYEELLADWRLALAPAVTDLELDLGEQLAPGRHHDVDDFIEPSLRRVVATWEGTDLPETLRGLADDAWTALAARARGDIDDQDLGERLDSVRTSYRAYYEDSAMVVTNRVNRQTSDARRAGRRASVEGPGETSVATHTSGISARDLVGEVWRRGKSKTGRIVGRSSR
ncbi:hypothetical protein KDY119_02594 [Luteimicrobium xylanilyticum]|uniref:Sulfotransferase family protein n=1 Tax=Luteimicrobium xylanilyticum TaxID=1133546 RepID=A0A5P9QC90_9MICO|nr:hypothetical protein KDY119_02594 [Luteimicrobium xylanilyticum]